MHPTFHIAGTSIGGYMLMLIIACVVCAFAGRRLADRFDISRRVFLLALVAAVLVGYFTAAAQSIVFELGVARWLQGGKPGLAIHGGIVGGVLAIAAIARLSKVGVRQLLDLMACVLPLGMAIARWGCLFHGCCWGKPTLFPIALIFPSFDGAARPVGVPLHATQLYLSAFALITFVALVRYRVSKRRYPGQLLLESFGALSVGRFFIEFLRADPRGPAWLSMPLTQWVALIVALIAITLWWRADKRYPAPPPRPQVGKVEGKMTI